MSVFQEKLNVVVFGGGTGSDVVLKGFRESAENGADIVAVTPVSDDGGSSGLLRQELGILPPGDIRAALVSMARNEAQEARYSERLPDGHSAGNLVIADLQVKRGLSLKEAIEVARMELDSYGRAMPVSLGHHVLSVYDEGRVIVGESNIGKSTVSPNAKVRLLPEASLNPDVEDAIGRAEHLFIAPSNFRVSVLAILAVRGMRETLRDSKAELTFVAPLLNVPGHSDGWHVADFVTHMERYYLDEGRVDKVLYHNAPLSPHLLEYARPGEHQIATHSEGFKQVGACAVGADIVLTQPYMTNPNDTAVHRTKIRQDPYLLQAAIRAHILDPSRENSAV
jgi:uncharacterized cofD-like protein